MRLRYDAYLETAPRRTRKGRWGHFGWGSTPSASLDPREKGSYRGDEWMAALTMACGRALTGVMDASFGRSRINTGGGNRLGRAAHAYGESATTWVGQAEKELDSVGNFFEE